MGYKPNDYKISRKNPRERLREDAELDFGIYVGEVIVRPKDQSHSGRIPVYIPMLSKDRNDPKGYYNAYWSSPFAGTTPSASVGDNEYKYQDTMKTYGMWMVPPDPGNFVLVIFGDGKKKNPIIIGCLFPDQMQNMVPGNPAGVTYGTDKPMPVAEKNRKVDNRSHGKEVQRPLNPYIAWPIVKQGLINDPVRGTTTSGARRESPSQVFGILTPGPEDFNFDTGKLDGTHRKGGHSFVLDDNEDQRHIRLRTAGGAQLLLDDTNEIVYIINSPGTAWVELAKDGSVNVFSDEDFNLRATSNVNIRADHTLNLDAGVRVNINAGLLDDQGGDVDTLKLNATTGGEIHMNAGDSINQLSNKLIKMQTRDDDSSISAGSQGQLNLYAKSQLTTLTPESTIIQSGADTFLTSGGSGHIVSGGQSFVKGSTVHLNDGGSTGSAVTPAPIEPIPVSVFPDEPMSVPVFIYDHQDTTPRDPLGGQDGLRKSDPGTLDEDILDPDGNYSDFRGDKIKVASTTTMITTREPWFNHLTEDKRLPSGKSYEQSDMDRDLGNRYPPATTGTGYEGPDSEIKPDGTFELGVGYDGVSGPDLQDYVASQYFDTTDPTSYKPKNPTTAKFMTPDYDAKPQYKSNMLSGSEAVATYTDEMNEAVADGISRSQHYSNVETPLNQDSMWNATDAKTCIGYKHIIEDKEKEAGVIMFGDGKNFDPTSETTMLNPVGKSPISVAEVSDVVKNAGPGANLTRFGIQHASDVNPKFSSNDNAYAIKDKDKGFIYVNGISAGFSKPASTSLLENDLIQHARNVTQVVKRPLSINQIAALTIKQHVTGPSMFGQHRSISMMNSGGANKNIARSLSYSDANDYYWYGAKDYFVSYLFQTPDKFVPEVKNILGRDTEWQFKASMIANLHRRLKNIR